LGAPTISAPRRMSKTPASKRRIQPYSRVRIIGPRGLRLVAIALSSLVYIGFTLFLLYGALTQGFSPWRKRYPGDGAAENVAGEELSRLQPVAAFEDQVQGDGGEHHEGEG
jgi:hypothetical protein